jgi:serine/threonine protein kinase
VPRIYAYGNVGGLLQVIVMENVGKPLRTLAQYEERKADIDDAISKIHGLNVKHGDLRGPNIMVDLHGNIRIIDFGMSSKVTGKIIEYVELSTFNGTQAELEERN